MTWYDALGGITGGVSVAGQVARQRWESQAAMNALALQIQQYDSAVALDYAIICGGFPIRPGAPSAPLPPRQCDGCGSRQTEQHHTRGRICAHCGSNA